MKKHSRNILLTVAIIISLIFGGGVFALSCIVLEADEIKLETAVLDQTTFIYATDPETEETVVYDSVYDDENRVWVEFDKIPKDMVNAFIAIEDQRFYSHHGFDVKRLIGAMTTFVSKGNSSYGASTITQQLVKNISGDEDVNVKRKLREIYRAVKIEQTYSKEEIMEFYLNTIYLSNQCNGVEAASQRYFGKNVGELSLAQIASIAGITQFPSRYDPLANPDANKEKQEVVLSKMLELEFISQEEYDEAVAEKLDFSNGKSADSLPATNRYFSDAVINEVLEDLEKKAGYPRQIALKMLYTGGLKIYSSVNPRVQEIIEEVYSDDNNFPASYGDEIMQSSIVVLDPKTGNIAGMSGGRGNEGRMTLNRATQTLRQPGSSIKPIAVYGPALEMGIINENSIVVDEPLRIGEWAPKNSDRRFRGSITIKSAVASSINIAAIKVLQSLGVEQSYSFLKDKLHISSLVDKREEDDKVYSDKDLAPLSLGGLTDGVSVLEMAAAYVPFANGGTYYEPSTYYTVTDFDGNVLLEHDTKGEEVYLQQNAYAMTKILSGVVSYGTGTGANLGEMSAAGKTGTSNDNKDKWFVGYTPHYLAAVWSGYDTPKAVGGGNPSVSIWKKVMSKVHEDYEDTEFEKPDPKNEKVKICSVSGKIATELCALDIRGSQIEYKTKEEVSETEKCDKHKAYTVCVETGNRARGDCPKRRVSALGVENDDHSVEDGYITKVYCTKGHYVEKVKVCTESGLLAGDNCPETKDVSKFTAPGKKCEIEHSEKVTEEDVEDSGSESETPTGTAAPTNAPQTPAPKSSQAPEE